VSEFILAFYKRGANTIMKMYFHYVNTAVKPWFEAKIDIDVAKYILEQLGISYNVVDKHNWIIINGNDDSIRRFIIYVAVRRYVDKHLLKTLLDIVKALSLTESLFWYSQLIYAYDGGGLKSTAKVAKAFKVLYEL